MNKWKKAISVGMSATLLASLFTVIAASSALGSTAVTSAGNVPQGGTSASAATFSFTEKSVNALTTGGNFSVYIWDSTGDCAVAPGVGVNITAATVHFTGTATQSGPDSLGLSALVVGDNFFTIKTTAHDDLNVESVTIGGLSIKADTTAATGAIKACVYNDSGIFGAAFGTAIKAQGTLSTGYASGTTNIVVNVSTTACPFAVTVGSDPDLLSFATLPETKAITAASALGVPGPNQQTLTIAATANNHQLGEAVSQAISACGASTALGSPGSVVKSLRYLLPDQTRVNPGETNQSVANLSAKERDSVIPDGPPWTASFFTVGGTLTLTITTPGVTFSNAPLATATNGLLFNTTPSGGSATVYGTLSADRQSATWTVNAKSTAASVITWSNIFYDVAASVATGTAINVTLASSDGVVAPTSRSNAVVGRVLNVTSTAPVVYIGENNQTAGQITITETGAGFFQSGTGSNNTFVACIIFDGFSNSQFAAAPWAKVTAGDLRLREGTTASSDNVVQGTPITVAGFPFACYYWTVWTASTTASTVVISGDEAGTVGVKLNVPAGDAIGPVTASIRTGDITGGTFSMILEARTVIAVKQFRNQVSVTALSQPTIAVGSTGSPAGDIQIQETANGQLKTGETICVQIVPNQNWNTLFDAYLKGLNTADLPIVTGSNGVIPTAVSTSTRSCSGQDELVGGFAGSLIESFSFNISQQSISGNGKLVISNLKYATANDAVTGQVQVMVEGYSGSNTQLTFQSIISNAKIGSVLAGTAASRLGVTQVGAFTTSTKVQKVGKYVTFRFDFGVAAAGAHVDIWVATKTGNDWTGFTKLTSRVANASGVVYYYIRQSSATWKSYRAAWGGGGVLTPARQARWIP